MKTNRNQGYTLLEVVVVISIIAVLSSAAVISSRNIEQYRLDEEIEMIAADLRWARKKAILDNQTYIFKIYTSLDNQFEKRIPYYFYVDQDGEEVIKRRGSYSADLILYKTLSLRIIEDEYYDWIRFTDHATARAGTIGLGRAGGEIYSITVNKLGRVRIEK